VEANFASSNLQTMYDFVSIIMSGAIPPVSIDGEYGEYSSEGLTVMLSMKSIPKF
jgi:hypothetical protein